MPKAPFLPPLPPLNLYQPGPAGAAGAVRFTPAETLIDLKRSAGISPAILTAGARLADFSLIALLGVLITFGYISPAIGVAPAYTIAIPAVALAAVLAFQSLGLYRLSALRAVMAHSLKLLGAFAGVFLVLMAVVFFMKLEGVFSRAVFSLWFSTGALALMIQRMGLALIVRQLTRRGALDRRVAIVGGGEPAARLIEVLTRQEDSELRICGIFDDRTDDRSPELIAGFPKLGGIDELVAYARRSRIDTIIFALPVTAEARIVAMLKKLWVLPADIRLAAHTQQLKFLPRSYSFIGSLPVFDLADKPFGAWDALAKSVFDRIVGAMLLVALMPLMALVALAIRLDSRGPVLFRQKRYGFNNQLIEVFKFRSMRVEALDYSASKLVTPDDPRVTRVGRFIRRTSLDELPQLINVVFSGSLSLVGPRPHAVHAKAENRTYDEVVDGYFARHKVKPGITGWAQVNGWRGQTDTEEKIQKRVEHDLYYIENWSPLFDLTILALTPLAVLRGENAH